MPSYIGWGGFLDDVKCVLSLYLGHGNRRCQHAVFFQKYGFQPPLNVYGVFVECRFPIHVAAPDSGRTSHKVQRKPVLINQLSALCSCISPEGNNLLCSRSLSSLLPQLVSSSLSLYTQISSLPPKSIRQQCTGLAIWHPLLGMFRVLSPCQPHTVGPCDDSTGQDERSMLDETLINHSNMPKLLECCASAP
ncbi:hypothetical protein HUJ04_011997 [Dendroctonus ponderosae]|nr:hypothetical protein HUJ04_011997 [Dendroctonus ponderosae]